MNLSLSDALKSLGVAHVESVLLPVLFQLILIIVAARLFAALFRSIGQPAVVGEIASGLVLGPSLLGMFFPEIFSAVFHPSIEGVPDTLSHALFGWILTILSQLGLILLLFLIGLEFDFTHLRFNGLSALSISAAGVAVPFGLGVAISFLIFPVVGEGISWEGFALFLGTALSITAIPILGRIMLELGIHRTRLGAITISAAAVDDGTGWILLASITAIVRSQFSPLGAVWMIAQSFLFAGVMIGIVRPLLRIGIRWLMKRTRGKVGVNTFAVLLGLLLLCSIVTNLIGIFAIFGAFLLGAVLSGEKEFREAVKHRLQTFVTAFFLPIFFCYTGLRTDIGSLDSLALWGLCGLVLAAAIVGKFGGCWIAAKLSGHSGREAGCIGAMMNCRALMELIVINVGRDLGVIPPSVFTMLVIMALVTTIMTTPLLLWCMRGTELEPYIRRTWYGEIPSSNPEANGELHASRPPLRQHAIVPS